MQWSDEGIILGTRPHGETSCVLEVMTREHGRHLGLVRGGRSRRQQPVLQAGNSVSLTWMARLDQHLGNYTVELAKARAARLMEGPCGLFGMTHLASLLRLLPEREAHQGVYEALQVVVEQLDDIRMAGPLIVRFEFEILSELGFGLDFSECAATGRTEDLTFVSPKSGRAVSTEAAEPYRDRLLPLPAFLLEGGTAPDLEALRQGFSLTGYFLERHVYQPRGLTVSESRAGLVRLAGQ